MQTAPISPYGREITPERREQGFVSQAHLDAFYAHHDHARTCPTCLTPGTPVELEDGLQPTSATCEVERDLLRASFVENFG